MCLCHLETVFLVLIAVHILVFNLKLLSFFCLFDLLFCYLLLILGGVGEASYGRFGKTARVHGFVFCLSVKSARPQFTHFCAFVLAPRSLRYSMLISQSEFLGLQQVHLKSQFFLLQRLQSDPGYIT